MVIIVGIGKRQHREFDELGAAQPQHVLLFLALGVGNKNQRAIAARACHHCQPNAGVAGGRLNHESAGPEIATLLGLEDHPLAGAVLNRLTGIHEFSLAENGAAGQLRSVLQLDERRVADRVDDVVVNGHVYQIAGLLPNRWATLKDRRRAYKPAISAPVSRIWRIPPDARRYFPTGIPLRNTRDSIPTGAGSDRRSLTASGSARPRGNCFARSRASWHNLARKCVRG